MLLEADMTKTMYMYIEMNRIKGHYDDYELNNSSIISWQANFVWNAPAQ